LQTSTQPSALSLSKGCFFLLSPHEKEGQPFDRLRADGFYVIEFITPF